MANFIIVEQFLTDETRKYLINADDYTFTQDSNDDSCWMYETSSIPTIAGDDGIKLTCSLERVIELIIQQGGYNG